LIPYIAIVPAASPGPSTVAFEEEVAKFVVDDALKPKTKSHSHASFSSSEAILPTPQRQVVRVLNSAALHAKLTKATGPSHNWATSEGFS
jgi:hypothetical protein